MADVRRMFTSWFGLGLGPIAPGTWGSLGAAVPYFLLCAFGTDRWVVWGIMGLIVLTGSAVCVAWSGYAIERTGKSDPGEVVADEAAGQAIAFIGVMGAGIKEAAIITLAGFLAFRVFDIIKPFPCRRLEKLPKGWGILADDIAAGVYALTVVQVFVRWMM